MGTKNNPGAYDCYQNAEPDEPMFVLLARDPLAPGLVEVWRALCVGNFEDAIRSLIAASDALRSSTKSYLQYGSSKSVEAGECAAAMRHWQQIKEAGA